MTQDSLFVKSSRFARQLTLTFWTPYGAASAKDFSTQVRSAYKARFASAVVDLEIMLEIAGIPTGLAEIADGRAAGFNGAFQHISDVVNEFSQALAGHFAGCGSWSKPCAKTRFLGVNVAYADDDRLIHD